MTTTPYTFVPFSTPITAGKLWRHDNVSTPPTQQFDRTAAGLLSGHIDITCTALSPLYVGDVHANGSHFTWPTSPASYGIPGSGLRGMLRASIAALTGGSLGLHDDDDVHPTNRHPVAINDLPMTAKARKLYNDRRNPGTKPIDPSATAQPGKQRVGLLQKTGNVWTVDECPQFLMQPPQRGPTRPPMIRKVPTVRWGVVKEDLLAREPRTATDARAQLAAWRGALVHVVWALVAVAGVPRPCAIGLGFSTEAAAANARRRAAANHIHEVSPLLANGQHKTAAFAHFLAEYEWVECDVPEPRVMLLFPTNLANLADHGTPTTSPGDRAKDPANCYLLEPPGGWLGDYNSDPPTYHQPGDWIENNDTFSTKGRSVTHAAIREMRSILERKTNSWMPALPTKDFKDWPVFFDTDPTGTEVTHLGASNGFTILTEHTVRDAVIAAGGRWEHTLTDHDIDSDVVDAIFGAISDDRQIRSRIEVGHAYADPDTTTLHSEDIALLGPHLESAATRLTYSRPDDLLSYDNEHPRYRGYQFYWHRGTWNGDGTTQWAQSAIHHRSQFSDEDQLPTDATSTQITPIAVGSTLRSRLNFTNLSPSELGLILFALNFAPANPQVTPPLFAHKIGGAKPLGLGSTHLTTHLTVLTADRYLDLDSDGIDTTIRAEDLVSTFLEAVRWRDRDKSDQWVHVPDTRRAWPRHVAAWLLAHRWAHRPAYSATAEASVNDFRSLTPSLDVFSIPDRP